MTYTVLEINSQVEFFCFSNPSASMIFNNSSQMFVRHKVFLTIDKQLEMFAKFLKASL